ncbi:MAG: pre-peptidase C-terminal domain-containing protein [Cognaticolwellia sp.]
MHKFKLGLLTVAMFTIGFQAQAAKDLFSPIETLNNKSAQTLKVDVDKRSVFTINKGALKADTKSINILLDDNLNIAFDKTKSKNKKSGALVWQGIVSSKFLSLNTNIDPLTEQKNSATLIERDNTVTGTIRYQGKLYRIRPTNNGTHTVELINEARMQDHADNYIEPQSNTFEPSIQPLALTLAANPVIDVLVVYTASAASQAGNIASLIDLAEIETNNGYSSSGVNLSVNVVHTAQVSYSENSSSERDLSRLAATNDGYMDNVHALRDTYGADMVVLVSDVNGYCGQADAIYANSSSAFAIVDYDCATGYYSFGHELGHLQGARHNPENDPSSSPFSYGHGYQDPQQNWRTVMAYNCSSNCTRQLFWSNPNKTYSGRATGTNSLSDNTRVLNATGATMAAFKTAGSSTWTTGGANNLAASQGNWQRETVSVPAGATQLVVDITGGSGDADLYLHSSSPTTSSYTCRPWLNGNTETCTIDNPSAGTWHIGVRAYSTYSSVDMTWKYK